MSTRRDRQLSSAHRRRRLRHAIEPLEDRQLLALVISEINYEPYATVPQFGETGESANDYEFIELLNTGPAAVNLQGWRFIQVPVGGNQEGVIFNFTGGTLAAGERIVIVNDLTAFGSRYGTNIRVAGEWSGGNLANSGETLTLVDPNNSVKFQVAYDNGDDWPTRAAGQGATLEIVDVAGMPNDPDNWQSSREFGGTPGRASEAPRQPRVIINEVLAHTDLPQRDSVEFHNLTNAAINISGWYFAAGTGNPFRFRFPAGSTIPPNGYLVIDERHFNPGGGDLPNDFAISELGETVRLISANAQGRPLLLEDYAYVGPTANGVSVGNVNDVRAGSELIPLAQLTLNAANGGHRVSEVVISEIQYHPPDDDVFKEFIELQNTTNAAVTLAQWAIEDAFDITIPAGTVLNPGETVVLVAFNPTDQARATAFREYYEIDGSVRLIGPWGRNNSGQPQTLSNTGEPVTLRLPLIDAGEVYLAIADQVDYNDSEPWPLAADGDGASLTRPDLTKYGNLPASWQAARPSPGNLPIDYSNTPLLEVGVPMPAELGRDDQMLRGLTDVDVFQFEPGADGSFEFRTQAVGAGATTALRVFSSDKEEIGFSNHPAGSTENRLTVDLQAGAVYYVVVSGSSDLAQNYDPFTGANLVSSSSVGSYTIVVEGSTTNPTSPWQNTERPNDVNASGSVEPFDALLVINALNSMGSIELPAPGEENAPPPFIDVNGDNFLSAIDALLIINELNGVANGEGEPESPSTVATNVPRPALALAAAAVDDAFAMDDNERTGLLRRR